MKKNTTNEMELLLLASHFLNSVKEEVMLMMGRFAWYYSLN